MNHVVAVLAQAGGEPGGLTVAGTVIMAGSILMVLGLASFCMVRILGEKDQPEGHHHSPLDIDRRDTE